MCLDSFKSQVSTYSLDFQYGLNREPWSWQFKIVGLDSLKANISISIGLGC